MFSARFHLFLIGLAAAAAVPDSGPHYPARSRSNGFTLVANLTDSTRDLKPSVHGWVLTPLHDDAGGNFAALGKSAPGKDTVFYENGTTAQVQAEQAHILFDGTVGSSQVPFGISVGPETEDGTVEPVRLDSGAGTIVGLAGPPDPYAYVTATAGGTFVACPTMVAVGRADFMTVGFVYGPPGGQPSVPDDCAPITLVPQCAKLPGLTPDPTSNVDGHEFAAEVSCYDDVADLHWD